MRDNPIARHASVRDLEIDNAMRTADRFARLGNIDKAAPIYQRILDRDANHAGAQAKLAELAFATNAFDIAAGVPAQLGLRRRVEAVKNTRTIGKKDMIHNGGTPNIEVDAQTYEVRADGVLLTCEPATELPMAQRYFLF